MSEKDGSAKPRTTRTHGKIHSTTEIDVATLVLLFEAMREHGVAAVKLPSGVEVAMLHGGFVSAAAEEKREEDEVVATEDEEEAFAHTGVMPLDLKRARAGFIERMGGR